MKKDANALEDVKFPLFLRSRSKSVNFNVRYKTIPGIFYPVNVDTIVSDFCTDAATFYEATEDDPGEDSTGSPKAAKIAASYYAFMNINLTGGQKTQTHIGVDKNPLTKHTRKRKKRSPHKWLLVAIAGPFKNEAEAIVFSESWRTKSRGMASRIKRCCNMVKQMKKKIWLIEPEKLETIINKKYPKR